jgi:hypothetical protein
MQLQGKVMGGKTVTITTKQGNHLDKTRLRFLDIGEEAAMDLVDYWVDFIGDAALTEQQIHDLRGKEVVVQIKRVSMSLGSNGKSYLNISGGLILPLHGGEPIQPKLAQSQMSR